MKYILTREEWYRKRRRKRFIRLGVVCTAAVLVLVLCFFSLKGLVTLVLSGDKEKSANSNKSTPGSSISPTAKPSEKPTEVPEDLGIPTGLSDKLKKLDVKEMLLTPNEYSRPQKKLEEVKGIVIHYVANKGTTAEANRNYFETLKTTHTTSASSHFIVGLKGEIIQCIPVNEWAYATTQRNKDTISIETCHPDDDGKFSDITYDSLTALTAVLCDAYDLETSTIIRHYDVTGKSCPKYYVDNEDAWKQFLKDVDAKREKKEDVQ